MFDVETQSRFNRSCTSAMVNYMNAGGAAYQAMAHQAIKMWSDSVDAMIEPEQPKPACENPGGKPAASAPETAAGAKGVTARAAAPARSTGHANTMTPFGMPAEMFAAFGPWVEMMKPANATAWPMAVGMMSVGVPEQVAWPAARGNAAALDAFNVVAKSVEKAMKECGIPTASGHKGAQLSEGPLANPFQPTLPVVPFNPALLMQMFGAFRTA